jgi:hypothetical protein
MGVVIEICIKYPGVPLESKRLKYNTTIQARFEVSPVHHAIRAHTRELCPNGQTLLQILPAPFSCEGNCGKRHQLLFFFLASSLIPPPPPKNMFCSTEDFRV